MAEKMRALSTTSKAAPTFVARLTAAEQAARRVAALAAETYGAGEAAVALADSGGGRWRVAIHFRGAPDENAVRALVAAAAGTKAAAALRFESIAAEDWISAGLAGLPPVAAGRFIVHGAHDRGRVPPNRIGIEIEAALAFGTGHHGTTRGCLLALDAICKAQDGRRAIRRVLDVGAGSGVLAIAAARALHRPVLATDIDANAVATARANARRNRAGALLAVVKADGVPTPLVRARAPFDLVFANILLRPLQKLAAPLKRLTAGSGRLVLSGITPAQAAAVIAAYRPFALERRLDLGGWTTLVLVRRRPRAVAAVRAGP